MRTAIKSKTFQILLALVFSSSCLIATSGTANAAGISYPGTTITPVSGTPDSENPSGNQSGDFWYEWVNSSGTGYLTVDTCTGSNLGSGSHSVSVYESSTRPGSAPTSAMTASQSNNCGSSGKGKQYTVAIATSKTYHIKITLPSNGTYNFTASFSVDASLPSAATSSYVSLDRVTICHRTHATTNPYRIITVSTSSIVGALADGSPIRGHAKHATDARRYDPARYGVYDSSRTYKPSEKLWGDIIPPFKDASTGGEFPGLNWTWADPTSADSDTNRVLDKSEFGTATTSGSSSTVNQSAVDICKGASGNITSSEYFDIERKNGGQKRQEILDELTDTDQYEPDVYKDRKGVDSKIPSKEGPKKTPTNTIAQSLDGVVWLDINRNGFQEDNEPFMSNIKVTVSYGNSPALAMGGNLTGFGTGGKVFTDSLGANSLTTFIDTSVNKLSSAINSIRNLLGMATTYTVYTDANGYFIFKSLDSGDWYVSGVVPAGLDVTYDSNGIADATVDTTVPAGGHASTWIGLMGDSTTGINAPVKNPDGTPATKDVVLTASGIDGIFCNADDINYIVTPVNGVVSLTGLTNSSYYIRQIGTTSTIADFNITTGQIYTSEIKTVKGVRCSLLGVTQLANTGASVFAKVLGVLVLLALGGLFVVAGGRRKA